FMRSKGGSAQPHFRYSYEQAILDTACRPVQFVEAQGETTFRTEDNRVHSVTIADTALTDIGERRRLRSALEWIGERSIAEKMLADANEYIIGLRKRGDTDSA